MERLSEQIARTVANANRCCIRTMFLLIVDHLVFEETRGVGGVEDFGQRF